MIISGTDYPAWYRECGGAVLATTIDKSCYLSCRSLPTGWVVRMYRIRNLCHKGG
jgi:galactokinase/mevalonate kinase-like predicted kinase